MKDLLEYTHRSYEEQEQFRNIHKLKCVTLVKDQVCICIHSMAMNYLLYIADSCYDLEGDAKYSVEWNSEYCTYFLTCFYNGQIVVPLMRKDCPKGNGCYLEKELCEIEELPFHFVKLRLDKQWTQGKEEHLRTKNEKVNDGWDSLLFSCKIVEGFRTCSDREYGERLLRSALFLFPFRTWELLEKAAYDFKTQEERRAFIFYHMELLKAFLEMCTGKQEKTTDIINTVGQFLEIPISSIWEECEEGFTAQDFEIFLKMKLAYCCKMSKRLTGILNKIEDVGKSIAGEKEYKEYLSRCRRIVNGMKRKKQEQALQRS